MLKYMSVVVLAIGMLSLSGCTTSDTREDPPSPTQTAEVPPLPATASEQELYGKNAIFLSEFVQIHPDYFDPSVLPGSFLLEKAGEGPADYLLPDRTAGSNQLVLTIFCDDDSNYQIALVSGDKVIDRTWGDSCGSNSLVTYQSAPIEPDVSSLTVAVTVDEKTSFRVSVLEVRPA